MPIGQLPKRSGGGGGHGRRGDILTKEDKERIAREVQAEYRQKPMKRREAPKPVSQEPI